MSSPAKKVNKKGPGRPKNSNLEDLDSNLQAGGNEQTEQSEPTVEKEQQQSTSKRPAASSSNANEKQKKAKKAKKAKKKQLPETSSSESSDEESSDSETDSSGDSSDSSDDGSVETAFGSKARGFIRMKRNPLVTVDAKGSLRKTERLLKKQSSLMDSVDKDGRDAFIKNYDEVKENYCFVKELRSSIKNEVPNNNNLKKPTLANLATVKTCIKSLATTISPNEEAPQWGYHLLDWSSSKELKKCIGKAAARKVRTAIKAQRKQHKMLFSKSPAVVAQTWKSRASRGNGKAGGFKDKSKKPPFAKKADKK